ncbi:hypothetical protein KQI69_07100 [Eubacterium sp. MSJ-13]|uniref:hypothetical protein n=1 Tax=Eubacterium sp. MSJ-13 TaxID=2841513 RepID=UPI001C102CF7|nr:hypothetical protein [Eubacterium sp. MSJ-13]MBU5478970.1 hypothetical protein [Eubacterium sp. MSJ-13]
MRKRFLAMVMGLVLTASMITGCAGNSSSDSSSNTASSSDVSSSDDASSSNTDSDSSKDSENGTNAEESEYTVYGKVTSVSNDGKVTYEVLSKDENMPQMPQGSGAPDAKDGEKPQMPQGSGAPDAKNGEKPQMPQGSTAPDAKNGEKPQMPQGSGAPDGKNGGIPGFKSTGETATVTLSDDVTVQKSGMDQTKTDASVSDIKKGSIIGLAFDGDNVTKVLIREDSGRGGKGRQSGKSDDSQNQNTSSEESDNTNNTK